MIRRILEQNRLRKLAETFSMVDNLIGFFVQREINRYTSLNQSVVDILKNISNIVVMNVNIG